MGGMNFGISLLFSAFIVLVHSCGSSLVVLNSPVHEKLTKITKFPLVPTFFCFCTQTWLQLDGAVKQGYTMDGHYFVNCDLWQHTPLFYLCYFIEKNYVL
jgi:hypothetical protein